MKPSVISTNSYVLAHTFAKLDAGDMSYFGMSNVPKFFLVVVSDRPVVIEIYLRRTIFNPWDFGNRCICSGSGGYVSEYRPQQHQDP